jgi:glycosyltransferase involved in cell wall biosynthesis
MPLKPKLSLCISAFNEEDNLKACIDSLLEAESIGANEIILLNNGSTDKTESIMNQYSNIENVKIISFKNNKRLQAARNHLLEKCIGEFAVFLDADGQISKGYINILLDSLEDEYAIYSGPVIEQSKKTNFMYELHYKSLIDSDPNFLIGANFSVNKKAAIKLGGFPNITRVRGDESPLIDIMKSSGLNHKFIKNLVASNHFISDYKNFLTSGYFEGQNSYLCSKFFKQKLFFKTIYKSLLTFGILLTILGSIVLNWFTISLGLILIIVKLLKNRIYWKSVILNSLSLFFKGSIFYIPAIPLHAVFHEIGFLTSLLLRSKPNTLFMQRGE